MLTETAIVEQAKSEMWGDMVDLITTAKRVLGESRWREGFDRCARCGRLVCDVAVYDGAESHWRVVDGRRLCEDCESK